MHKQEGLTPLWAQAPIDSYWPQTKGIAGHLDMPPLPHQRPRLFQAYCVGLGRTGTTSISKIFNNYRSWKSLQNAPLKRMLIDLKQGKLQKKDFEHFLARRDQKIWAEMESNGYIRYYVDFLVRLFPEAKFVLTTRDCYSWCDSMINHIFNKVSLVREPRYPLPFGFKPALFQSESHILKHIDSILDRLLAEWARTETLYETCPPSRLFVVKTEDISKSLAAIAEFIGIPADTLIQENSHVKQAPKFGILRKAPYRLLKDKFEAHCCALMEKHFPGLSLDQFLAGSRDQAPSNPSKARRRDPACTEWVKRADALITLGQKEEAAACLASALQLKPDEDILHEIAVLYQRSGYPRPALELFRRLTADDSNDDRLWLDQAETAAQLGQDEIARDSLVRFEDLNPNPAPNDLRRFLDLFVNLKRLPARTGQTP